MHSTACVAPTKREENGASFKIVATEIVVESKTCKTFGIFATMGEESLLFEDISDEYELVLCLCRRLRDGQPPLYQLRDIIEDYLVEWPFIREDELKKGTICDMMMEKYSE